MALTTHPEPQSFWTYKSATYRVVETHPNKLSQDDVGNWVPTVEYEVESRPDLTFFRAVTDFNHKFRKHR